MFRSEGLRVGVVRDGKSRIGSHHSGQRLRQFEVEVVSGTRRERCGDFQSVRFTRQRRDGAGGEVLRRPLIVRASFARLHGGPAGGKFRRLKK